MLGREAISACLPAEPAKRAEHQHLHSGPSLSDGLSQSSRLFTRLEPHKIRALALDSKRASFCVTFLTKIAQFHSSRAILASSSKNCQFHANLARCTSSSGVQFHPRSCCTKSKLKCVVHSFPCTSILGWLHTQRRGAAAETPCWPHPCIRRSLLPMCTARLTSQGPRLHFGRRRTVPGASFARISNKNGCCIFAQSCTAPLICCSVKSILLHDCFRSCMSFLFLHMIDVKNGGKHVLHADHPLA